MEHTRFWVRFVSQWTRNYTVHSFDSFKEADWYARQVHGEIYDYNYRVLKNYGYKEAELC